MASLTVRDLDDAVKEKLRVRAAVHGRSMEEEVGEILRAVLSEEVPRRDLVSAIRGRFESLGGSGARAARAGAAARLIRPRPEPSVVA